MAGIVYLRLSPVKFEFQQKKTSEFLPPEGVLREELGSLVCFDLWVGHQLQTVNDLQALVQVFIAEPGIYPTTVTDEQIADLIPGIVPVITAQRAGDQEDTLFEVFLFDLLAGFLHVNN